MFSQHAQAVRGGELCVPVVALDAQCVAQGGAQALLLVGVGVDAIAQQYILNVGELVASLQHA